MIQQTRLVEEFMELVRIDSETGHEAQISKVLKEKFAARGIRVAEDDAAAKTGHEAGNLIAELPAAQGMEDKPAIFFTCHMDTVTPGKGIQPRLEEDGYIRSDGTTILGADDKAGIAVLLEAIRVIQERQIPHGPIQFVITVGEEAGLNGARAMDPALLKADFGYALDSNGEIGEIAVAAPTQAKIHMVIYGKSAHAGVNPEDGISAIQVASRAISRMPLGRIDQETTANIGRFVGGGATNIVCDRVDLEAEARSLSKEKLDRQVEAMRSALNAAVEEFGAKADFHSEILYPAFHFDEQAPIVRLAMNAIRKIGCTPRTFKTGGGSDANIFNGMGVPTVNLAVGYEHIHTTREQIAVHNLVKLTELVLQIVQDAAEAN
jgi:tripeptide aminopeptidase